MERPGCLLSVDLEAWFHARLAGVHPERFDTLASGLEEPVARLLALLDRTGTRATFFTLGAVARSHPKLVRRVAERHEVASHGESHRDLHDLGRHAFEVELRSSRARLQELSGQPVIGFRAPNWSMAGCETWALPTLLEQGFRYDSSLVPGRGVLFVRGAPGTLREPHRHPSCPALWEFPPTVMRLPALSLPAGGAFLRLLPARWIRSAMYREQRRGGTPHIHIHPWELQSPRRTGVRPLRSGLLFAGSRSLLNKLSGILERFRAVAIEDHWRRLASESSRGEPALGAVGSA
jgi:polysaccharide deacetylase family protein (PEP-CTERM system associated)